MCEALLFTSYRDQVAIKVAGTGKVEDMGRVATDSPRATAEPPQAHLLHLLAVATEREDTAHQPQLAANTDNNNLPALPRTLTQLPHQRSRQVCLQKALTLFTPA